MLKGKKKKGHMQLLKLTLTMYQKPIEHKEGIWITFEQGRNELKH